MTNCYIAAQFTEQGCRIELQDLALVTDDGCEILLSDLTTPLDVDWFLKLMHEGAPRFVSYADTFGWCCISYYFGLIGINLPSGFVNHYYDLKQESERLGVDLPTVLPAEHSDCLTSARWARDAYNYLKDYEQKTNI